MIRKILTALAVLGLIFMGSNATAAETEFAYQGKLNVSGGPFSGQADFYFAILTKDGGTTETVQWVNDGGDLDVTPPLNPVTLDVVDGSFAVQIGDTSIVNMAELPPSIFNEDDELYLRIWVDADSNGIEQLTPDRRITLPAAIGVRSHNDLTIYVDSVNGDDRYPGHKASHPKKTIQAAIDVLPVILDGNTTIQLAAGTYPANVSFKNFVLSGKSSRLSLVGNELNPASVIIDGGSATLFGVHIAGIPAEIELRGFTIQDCDRALAVDTSNVEVHNCIITGSTYGILARHNSVMNMSDVTISGCDQGINAASNVYLRMENMDVSDCTGKGLSIHSMAHIYLFGTSVIDNCGTGSSAAGVEIASNSYANIEGNFTISNNAYAGVLSMRNSYVHISATTTASNNGIALWADQAASLGYNSGSTTFSGNTTNTSATNSGILF